MEAGIETVEAKDTCDSDSKKFKFEPSGIQCFRVKLFLSDRCLTFTMAARSDACDLEDSQWTTETSQSTCATLVQGSGDDGLPGGGVEGGEGGEAVAPHGGESGAIAAGALATSTASPRNST